MVETARRAKPRANLYGSKDDYVTKELLIEAMFYSTKRQHIGKVSQGVSIRKWLREVQEAGYVLGNIETKTAATPRANSRSVLKAKLATLDMRAHIKNADIEEILADITRGEQNRNPMEKQYYMQCPSFGLGNCTKKFCVA